MNNKIIALFSILLLVSCKKSLNSLPDQSDLQLLDNHGLVALQTDMLDYITSVRLIESTSRAQHSVNQIEKGKRLRLFQLPEGNYCIAEFVAYSRTFVFDGRGMCFYVESGDINYAGSLALRGGESSLIYKERDFLYQLNRYYPKVCRDFIGEACK